MKLNAVDLPHNASPHILCSVGPKSLVASAIALAFGVSGSVAFAQASGPEQRTETVVVTGTLIRGTAPVGSSVIGVDRAAIDQAGVGTTSEVLRQVPQVVNLGADEGHTNAVQNANANITFGTGINLRALGTESTLTLVNGRRVVPNGTMAQFVDTSMIPTLAIRGIEVVPDGASATYGSDAVGGVVNILLRQHYSGAQTELRYGTGKDIRGWQIGQLWGKEWDTGDVTLVYEHYYRSRLKAADRAFYTDDMRPFGGPDARIVNSNPGNILVGTTRYAIPPNQNGVGLTSARLTANTQNLQSIFIGDFDALPQQTRDSFVFTLNQQFSEKVSLFANGYWSKRDYVRYGTAQNPNLTVPSSNAFFVAPAGAALPLCAATAGAPAGARCETVNYSFFRDLGLARATGYENVSNATFGLNIDLGHDWNATVYTTYGDNVDKRRSENAVNNAQLTAALADSNPATALNVFGDGSFTNPATLDRIRASTRISAHSKLSDVGATADGPIFSLPGGKVRLAVGAEYQDGKNSNESKGSVTTPDTSTTVVTAAGSIKRSVDSVFAELYIPIIGTPNAMPGVQQLALSLAGRYDNYSDFGTTTNPKVGLTWVPVKGLSLRGSYGKSFRAPVLADIDPTQGGTVSLQNFVSPTGGTTRGILRQGGNAGLGPEKAKSWTLGVELKPSMLPGSAFSATYFNIDYKDRIQTPANLGTQALVQAPALGLEPFITRNPSAAEVNALFASPFFTGIPENPANILVIVDGRKQNTGQVKLHGLDLTARYKFASPMGQWDLGALASYFFNFEQSLVGGTPLVPVINTINNPLRFSARADVGFTRNQYSARIAANYANRYYNNLVTPAVRIPSYTTADLLLAYDTGETSGWEWGKGVRVSLSVQNLFDRKPPYVQNGTLAFDPQIVSAIGRYAALTVNKKW